MSSSGFVIKYFCFRDLQGRDHEKTVEIVKKLHEFSRRVQNNSLERNSPRLVLNKKGLYINKGSQGREFIRQFSGRGGGGDEGEGGTKY